MPKQSQLAERIASLRFTPLAMTSPKNCFLEWTHISNTTQSHHNLPVIPAIFYAGIS